MQGATTIHGRSRARSSRSVLDQGVAVAIAGQPSACAGVRPANARSNQPRVFGEKGASESIGFRLAPR